MAESTQQSAEDLSRDVYADAIRLRQTEILDASKWLALPIVAWILAGAVSRSSQSQFFVGVAALSTAVVLSRIAGATFDLRKLRRANPDRLLDDERTAAQALARDRENIRAHVSAVRPVITIAMAVTVVLIYGLQLLVGVDVSIDTAGLVKDSVRHGEWWRLVTASYLHGSLIHLNGNAVALLIFGRLIEAYDRRWRLPLVYMLSVLASSLMSQSLLNASSVGASGGVVGLAGYLLTASWRRQDFLPDAVRRALKKILIQTAIVGLVLFFLVDNAGHLGGVLMGALLGFLLTSVNTAPDMPKPSTSMLDAAGQIAGLAFVAGAVFTVFRLIAD